MTADEAHGWIGWSNRKKPLVIEFEFDSVQEFESVTLSAYCQLDLGIQPFTQMLAYFRVDESHNYHPQYLKSVNKGPLMDFEPQNITLSLDSRIGKFVKLELYFENKWIMLSEVSFKSKKSDKTKIETFSEIIDNSDDDNVGREVIEENNVETSPDNPNEQETPIEIVLSDTPKSNDLSGNSEDAVTSISSGNSKGDGSLSGPTKDGNNQMFIGLIIGVLGVTVILLLVTIMVMYRKNKQKIFNKHSVFKSPMAAAPGVLANSADRHMLREMSKYHHHHPHETASTDGGCEESNSIYQEPYRLVLARNRNSSCGRLCDHDYEEHGLLIQDHKAKFGSTPLFSQIMQPLPPPPPPNSTTTTGRPPRPPPTSFSCHEVKNGYAIPGGSTMPSNIHPRQPLLPNEGFYAATDIVLKVRRKLLYVVYHQRNDDKE